MKLVESIRTQSVKVQILPEGVHWIVLSPNCLRWDSTHNNVHHMYIYVFLDRHSPLKAAQLAGHNLSNVPYQGFIQRVGALESPPPSPKTCIVPYPKLV